MCFAISALSASAASRRVGAASTLAWVMAFGLLLIVVPTALIGDASQLSAGTLWLLAVAGLTNVMGLRIEYVAFRRGKVGVIAPIVSTEGAIAAMIAVIAGVHVDLQTLLLLVVVTVGVLIAAAHPDPQPPGHGRRVQSAVLALPVALLFGVSLYTTGRVGTHTSVLWVLASARVIGTGLITAPLAGRHQLKAPGEALALLAVAAVAEVLGILSYTLGARHQLAIAAVLASQFAALAAVGAYFVFNERLARSQVVGLVVVAVGVGVLAAVSN